MKRQKYGNNVDDDSDEDDEALMAECVDYLSETESDDDLEIMD